MKHCIDSENLHNRLSRIIGQIQAIDRMIDQDIPCEDILSQINATKSALHKGGQVVIARTNAAFKALNRQLLKPVIA